MGELVYYYCEDCKKDFRVDEIQKHQEHNVLEYKQIIQEFLT